MLAGGRTRAVAALAAGAVVIAAVVLVTQRGGGAHAPPGELVAAERGDVTITVGGVGHVNTLTGAARLAVPGGGSGGGTGSGSASTGSSAGVASPSSSSSSASGGGQAPADAVFPALSGHVERLFAHVGQQVTAGQPIATIADDGTTATNLIQARSDFGTARLELAQKRVQDPTRGLPPTPAELTAGNQAIAAARDKLRRVQGPPLRADVNIARNDLAKAIADARTALAGGPESVAAAQLAVTTARQKLQTLSGAPDRAEVAAAQLDLAKATADQQTLLTPPPPPSAAALRAADAAITLAQQHLTDALAAGVAADIAAARAELAKAQSERDALVQPAPGPTATARTAAQLAVDAARAKFDALLHHPVAAVSAAQQELA